MGPFIKPNRSKRTLWRCATTNEDGNEALYHHLYEESGVGECTLAIVSGGSWIVSELLVVHNWDERQLFGAWILWHQNQIWAWHACWTSFSEKPDHQEWLTETIRRWLDGVIVLRVRQCYRDWHLGSTCWRSNQTRVVIWFIYLVWFFI